MESAIIVGIDEAGYGPLLGPLVVTAVAFEVPAEVVRAADTAAGPDLWKLLRAGVSRKPLKRGARLAIADSKKLYDSADHENGLKLLELAALTFLMCGEPICGDHRAQSDLRVPHPSDGPPLTHPSDGPRDADLQNAPSALPATLKELLCRLCPAICDELGMYPWYAPDELRLPLQCSSDALGPQRNALRIALEKARVRFRGAFVEVVPEGHFNRMVEATRNKSVVLFTQTLRLIARLTDALGGRPMRIWADRHGGRVSYRQALMTAFEDASLEVLDESPEHSAYCLRRPRAPFVIRFMEKGESKQLPVALASIYSKYVRELFMTCFNRYWTAQLADLKPTAGYYKDGQRFLADITPLIARQQLDRNRLVRLV